MYRLFSMDFLQFQGSGPASTGTEFIARCNSGRKGTHTNWTIHTFFPWFCSLSVHNSFDYVLMYLYLKAMTANPDCATLDTSILDALHSMQDGKFLHIPVIGRSKYW